MLQRGRWVFLQFRMLLVLCRKSQIRLVVAMSIVLIGELF
jgi:hypothetical protein